MNPKIALIQMSSIFAEPEKNFSHAIELMDEAMAQKPDILVLPETFNTGFFPTDNLEELADKEGQTTKKLFSEYAKKHSVNIVAGSVTTLKNNKVFNTAYIFDKHGKLVAEYDKIHGFTPSGEHNYYQGGNKLVTFNLAGMKCGIIICYDIRFCELVRSLALKGIELLFIPAHWPLIRKNHWINLATTRAIENQMYVCAVNACSKAGDTIFGGNSLLINPWGEEICHLDEAEEVQFGTVDLSIIKDIRESINVFRDRKLSLYEL